jgi:hypothetical protein
MAEPAVVRVGLRIAACLGIKKDRLDDLSQIPSSAVRAIEHRRHPRDVSRAGIARDEVLNELL